MARSRVGARSSPRSPSITFKWRQGVSGVLALRDGGFAERRIGVERLLQARPLTLAIEKLPALPSSSPWVMVHRLCKWRASTQNPIWLVRHPLGIAKQDIDEGGSCFLELLAAVSSALHDGK